MNKTVTYFVHQERAITELTEKQFLSEFDRCQKMLNALMRDRIKAGMMAGIDSRYMLWIKYYGQLCQCQTEDIPF